MSSISLLFNEPDFVLYRKWSVEKARSVNEDMKRSLAHKERSTVIYETLMADYYQRLISAALGEKRRKTTKNSSQCSNIC